jgi:DNA-binding transcriptional MerR regulator
VYTRDQLLALAAVSPRTLGVYTSMGLLPRPKLAGPHTRYSEEQLIRLLAIGKLRDVEKVPLRRLRARLDAMTPDEMDDYVSEGPDEDPGDSDTAPGGSVERASPAEQGPAGRACTRYELAPGVELRVDAEAPESSRALVAAILRLRAPA